MAEAPEEKEIPSNLCLPAFKQGDEFLFSLSEFVKPAIKIRFLRAKQGYILFEYPNDITGQLRLEMRLFFVAEIERHNATISFSGEVYRIFQEEQLGFPALIVKAPSFFTYKQEKRKDPRIALSIPCRWWRTGSFKRGVVENLSIGGAMFVTQEKGGVNVGDLVKVEIEADGLILSAPIEGRVLRIDQRGKAESEVGVEFISLDAHDKKALDVYINRTLYGKK